MALLLVALCPPALVFGQETRGTISGAVRDASQGVIAGAPVKVNNLSRGISVSIITNDAGLFRAPYLVPGTYQLIVEARGFKKYVRDGVELRIGETLDINVALGPDVFTVQIPRTATPITLQELQRSGPFAATPSNGR